MNIIGFNVLNVALSVLGATTVTYKAFVSRALNDRGDWVNTYATGVQIVGAWQPIKTQTAKAMGIDQTERVWSFRTSNPLAVATSGTAPDIIIHLGKTYNVIAIEDWLDENGWRSIVCQEVAA